MHILPARIPPSRPAFVHVPRDFVCRCSFSFFVLQISKSQKLIARTDVAALNGGLGGSETQTDVLVPSSATLARSGGLGLGLRVLEDVRLLLESTLRLDGQLGRPDGEVSDSFVYIDIVYSFRCD
jgi:hypothetical protein